VVLATSTSGPFDDVPLLVLLPLPDDNEPPPHAASTSAVAVPVAMKNTRLDGLVNVGFPA
jgi:hypothetical protein